jgi:acetoin utilization deacetylase AcuC-like enzyme
VAHTIHLLFIEFLVSPLATVEELETTHSPEYIQRFFKGDQTEKEQRNVGFPWSPAGVDRATSSVGGTMAAACNVCDVWRIQKKRGLAPWGAHVAGGTHHAFYDYGEGFCVFSDIAVAANAVLFQGRPEVVTFSIHCEANYFSGKEKSDLDIEMPAGCNDGTYLLTLNHWLNRIPKEGGPFDLIFFQAGVDVLEDDRLGRMSLSADGVKRRNELVYDFARKQNVPLVICMGGGYPRDDWTPIIHAHANVYFGAYQYLARLAKDER